MATGGGWHLTGAGFCSYHFLGGAGKGWFGAMSNIWFFNWRNSGLSIILLGELRCAAL
jgi:hypothetical protein